MMNKEWEGLPAELVEQLKDARANNCSTLLVGALSHDTPMDVNEILIKVWRQSRVILKRSTVTAALSRLVKAGEIRKCGRTTYVRVST